MYLAKTTITPVLEQRVFRMMADVKMLRGLTVAEVRAIYADIEKVRDQLSDILDNCDGKI
jgi:hypothetical protein